MIERYHLIPNYRCKVCGGKNIKKAIDLGFLPNPNKLLRESELENYEEYPLEFYWCEDCTFFQQLDPVDSRTLFENNYTYQTGVNAPAVAHFTSLAQAIKESVKQKDLAVVIASNDGTEIGILKKVAGFNKVIGVEPARNIAEIANSRGHETINSFFGQDVGKSILLEYGKADLVMANNVFAHIPDPKGFLQGIKDILSANGVAIIEVQWIKNFVEKIAIEMLYAEHMYVWSAMAMKRICRETGLVVTRVDILEDQQGGSLRFWIKIIGKETKKLDRVEQQAGIQSKEVMLNLQHMADLRMSKLKNQIRKLRENGKTIDIWSVPAKVPIILNYGGINNNDIRVAYDSTPTKINRYIPKANIKIIDEASLTPRMKEPPDYIIIGAWNYLNYAIKKLSWFTNSGGTLINLLDGEFIKP